MKSLEDRFGNVTTLHDSGALELTLVKPRKVRNIGSVVHGVWFVRRLHSSQARGEGHWHHKAGCWFLEYQVLENADFFGIRAVDFEGYDGYDKFYRDVRTVAECLEEKDNMLHFKQQGFELQIPFRKRAKKPDGFMF